MTSAHPDIASLIREAQASQRAIRLSEARLRLGSSFCERDLAAETLVIWGDEITLPPTTWLRLLHRVQDRQQHTPTPPPDLQAPLTEPTLTDLDRLRRQLQRRRSYTTLEQVAREVGSSAYADMLAVMWDRTVVIRRGHIVGLPSGTYAMLLRDIIRQRRTEDTTLQLRRVGG